MHVEAVQPRQFAGHGCEHDDRDVRRGRLAVEDFANRKAVHVRQHQVEQDQIRQMLAGLVQGFHAVSGAEDLVAFELKVVADEFDDVLFIVHD